MTDHYRKIRPDTLFSVKTLSVKEQQEQETNIENLILKLESSQNLEANSLSTHVKEHLNPMVGNIDEPLQENAIFEETTSADLYMTNKSNFDEIAHAKTDQQKRLFFRRMEQKEFEWESNNIKRKDYDGIYDQDRRTYSPLTMAVTEKTMMECNEVWMNLHSEMMVVYELESAQLAEKKKKKVYRGIRRSGRVLIIIWGKRPLKSSKRICRAIQSPSSTRIGLRR